MDTKDIKTASTKAKRASTLTRLRRSHKLMYPAFSYAEKEQESTTTAATLPSPTRFWNVSFKSPDRIHKPGYYWKLYHAELEKRNSIESDQLYDMYLKSPDDFEITLPPTANIKMNPEILIHQLLMQKYGSPIPVLFGRFVYGYYDTRANLGEFYEPDLATYLTMVNDGRVAYDPFMEKQYIDALITLKIDENRLTDLDLVYVITMYDLPPNFEMRSFQTKILPSREKYEKAGQLASLRNMTDSEARTRLVLRTSSSFVSGWRWTTHFHVNWELEQ